MLTKLEKAMAVILVLCLLAVGLTIAFKLGKNAGKKHAIEHLQVEQVLHSAGEYGVVIRYQDNEYLHVCSDNM